MAMIAYSRIHLVIPVIRALIMQQPFFVESNLLQLMGQFLQIIIHLLSPKLFTHKLLKHTQTKEWNVSA